MKDSISTSLASLLKTEQPFIFEIKDKNINFILSTWTFQVL